MNQGVQIFNDLMHEEVKKLIKSADMPELPEETPDHIAKMVKERMWRLDPNQRISFHTIVIELHSFLKSLIYTFPEAKEMALNKLKGVKRKTVVDLDPSHLLCPPNIDI